jgi:hypothetical protein
MNGSMLEQILQLKAMTVAELQETWRQVFGESSSCRNKPFLWKRIAWELQARAYGRLSEPALDRIREPAPERHPRLRPPRGAMTEIERLISRPGPARPEHRRDPQLPPPGSTIVRHYHGRDLRVVVHLDHFEFEGANFTSLSALARHITGARSGINGRLFFGLTRRSRTA